MQRPATLRLFRRGPAAEVKLTLLMLVAFALLFTDATYKSTNPVRELLSATLYPFQRLVLFPRDMIAISNDWFDAAALIKSETEALQRQRIELAQVTTNAALLGAENAQLRRLLGVFEKAAEHPSVVVEVLYEPANTFSRRLIFNKGTRAGISVGMPILDEGGVVGQITRVSPMTSEAAMLTDEIISIPVQVLRNGLRLIAFGSSTPGKVEVRYFSSDADIREGDVLVTSGVGGVFPPGLSVGRIDQVQRSSASGFARAEALPSSHPERYRQFLVLQVPIEADLGVGSVKPATTKEAPRANPKSK